MAEAHMAKGIRDMLGELLGDLGSASGQAARKIGLPIPGGSANQAATQARLNAASTGDLGSDVARCPVNLVLTAQTRIGDLALHNITVYADGNRIGTTDAEGRLNGVISICEGRTRIKAVYENPDLRVKREEFTLDITGFSAASRQAQGGDARNFIAKVQDVFGSGEGGFPGDKDFSDRYSGADLVQIPPNGPITLQVTAKFATLSLAVPYRNQNDRAETINGVTTAGAALCMPSSAEMQARYWGIEQVNATPNGPPTRAQMDRRDIMIKAYNRAPKSFSLATFPRHWQDWTNLRGAMADLATLALPQSFTVGAGPAGGQAESIPGPYADGLTGFLSRGLPIVVSTFATTAGHVMLVIGAVVDHNHRTQWLIMNDPNGTLASADSLYGTLRLVGSVGLNGANAAPDVRAVQEALIRSGHYRASPGAPIDSADSNDPTIAAIRAFQGRTADGLITPRGTTEARINTRLGQGTRPGYSAAENETNRASDDRGRHVYYSDETTGNRQGQFRLKGQAWSSVLTPVTPLTKAQIAARLNPGLPDAPDDSGTGA